ncbi:MAG: DNA mismatch repair protein MutS [Treponema sp.]|jgi:DNA mismatch repair protein MutS|nr:DNA mismatch repair protein MutS [Treponema sp.]
MKTEPLESPMLAQYRRIKKDHQGDVLFFRLGDFYEMFAEDAKEVSALLNLTLTRRNGLPMCGIPYHAARSYIARLLKCGKKIAVCEQTGEPAKGKTLIEREVIEVISPGTTIDEEFLDRGSANYLAVIFGASDALAFAYIDLSTGEFCAAAFPWEEADSRLRQELERLDIKEIVVQEALLREKTPIARALDERRGIVVNRWADWLFDEGRGAERLHRQFGGAFASELGKFHLPPELTAAGALLSYLDESGSRKAANGRIPHIRRLRIYGDEEYMLIDEASSRNLELLRNLRDGDVHFSLLETLDETKTSMGRRLLKHRVAHPLRDISKIEKRLDMVDIFYHDQKNLSILRGILAGMSDFERLSSRIAMNRAHGKDMFSLKNALYSLEKCFTVINETQKNMQFEADEAVSFDEMTFSQLMELKNMLENGICDEPSILLTEGKLIRAGFNAKLDALHELRDNGRALLEAYLEEERQKTGISNLKIRYNRMLGYYFEVAVNQLSKIPSYFIKRQGLVSGERFTTDRLAALESDINGASDKIVELEKTLFLDLREQAKSLLGELSSAAKLIAELDTAQSLARAAAAHVWTRPVVDNMNRLNIIDGRHPVVEANLARGEFIPNNIALDAAATNAVATNAAVTNAVATNAVATNAVTTNAVATNAVADNKCAPAFALITGPNMAGKSTYLRQAALITIMAQMGSFVPARTAEIGVADRIYCRVGASDNLARGESTFLTEMLETAAILNSATEHSLVIMDEVGRGTGTWDGLSIAQAVSEHLLDTVKCRTLFATHYHELAALRHPRLANRSLLVEESGGEIVFRRRLVEEAAAESYGIHVARLAGIPCEVLQRAEQIMLELKTSEKITETPQTSGKEYVPPNSAPAATAGVSFRQGGENPVLGELAKLDINTTNPLEALTIICRWKTMLEKAPLPVKQKKPPKPPPSPQRDLFFEM